MTARWLIVLLTAATLVVAPFGVQAWPTSAAELSPGELAHRVAGSVATGWSGRVEAAGSLQVPDTESFARLAQLLGETSQLRVWWRGPQDWRVDRIRSTGEADLFRHGASQVRWVFESETATISPVSTIRLPDESDLVPATLARSLTQGAREDELSRLPTRRVAGIEAAGLRLTPHEPGTTVGHVDVWADSATGVAVRVDVYGVGEGRPVLTTRLLEVDLGEPAASATIFTPGQDVTVNYEESVDAAAAANALAPYDLPATLGGLASRNGADPGAVGIYGRGATTMIAMPLQTHVAWPLRERLQGSAAAQESAVGVLAPVGPVGLLVTPPGDRAAFLLAGTVTGATLRRAANELLASQ